LTTEQQSQEAEPVVATDSELEFVQSERSHVKFKVGTSLLTQFITSHDYLDCIIEALQNDFDAMSEEFEFSVGKDGVSIRGHGNPVDDPGWIRLSYTLGYNSPEERKVGSIGNKNQGVRSYLLFGDEVVFRSAGKKVLITPDGSSQEPRADETTRSKSGVDISVSLRAKPGGGLPAFDEDAETVLAKKLTEKLPGILSQLQVKGWERVLRKAQFTLTRTNVFIEVTQELLSTTRVQGFTKYQRKITLVKRQVDPLGPKVDPVNETTYHIEYVKTYDIPPTLPTTDIPSFFVRDGKLAVGLAIQVKNEKPVVEVGHLYYPLELANVTTGVSISVNAPFVLDLPRQGLVMTNPLNSWLLEQASNAMGELFKGVLVREFGANAYDLLCHNSEDLTGGFEEASLESIKASHAVLNESYDGSLGFEGDDFFCGEDTYLPKSSDLYGFIGDNKREVSRLLSSQEGVTTVLTSKLGAEEFNIHDVVELWSNDYTGSAIVGWHQDNEEDFIKELCDVGSQLRYASALVSHWGELSEAETKRVGNSSATLNALLAADSARVRLGRSSAMRRWDSGVEGVPKLDLKTIINQNIADHELYVRLLKVPTFELNDYVQNLLLPSFEGMSLEEKVSTSEFLLKNVKHLSVDSVNALKKSSVFRTTSDGWATFDKVVNALPAVKDSMLDSLQYPHKTLLTKEFLEVFPFRGEPTEQEIEARVAKLLSTRATVKSKEVLDFQSFLIGRPLTLDLELRLRYRILTVDTKGRICLVAESYLNTANLLPLLGNNVHYVDSKNQDYFKKLGAHERPRFNDMVNFIREVRGSGKKIGDKNLFYRELADAKSRDKTAPSLENEEIIEIGGKFVPPNTVLVYAAYRKRFFGSMNYWDLQLDAEGKTKRALLDLGCIEHPAPREYIRFLVWIAAQVEQGTPLDREKIGIIQQIYSQMPSGIPKEAHYNDRFLLTDDGHFTSLESAKKERVYYNDDEDVTDALKKAGDTIHFFDCGQGGHRFFQSLPIPKLTEHLRKVEDGVDSEADAPKYLQELFNVLRTRETINGILSYIQQNQQLTKTLRDNGMQNVVGLRSPKLAKEIFSTYSLDGASNSIRIEKGCLVKGDVISVRSNLSPRRMALEMAQAVAGLIVETRDAQSVVSSAIDTVLSGVPAKEFLETHRYSYHESVEVPPLELPATISSPSPTSPEPGEDVERSKFEPPTTFDETPPVTAPSQMTLPRVDVGPVGRQSVPAANPPGPTFVEVEDLRSNKSIEQIKSEGAEFFSRKEEVEEPDLDAEQTPVLPITGPVISRPKIVVVDEHKPIAGLNLKRVEIGRHVILATPDLPLPSEQEVSEFLDLVQRIIKTMGKDPGIAKVIVDKRTTDAKELRPDLPGQIGFNIMRSSEPPIYWMIIAAREVAGLKHKGHYDQMKYMARYLARALRRLREVDPELLESIKKQNEVDPPKDS
jgi:hypothetical protein